MSGGVVTAPHQRSSGRRLEVVYRIGVIVKGVDGLFEIVAGLLLWLAPGSIHVVLGPLAFRLSQGNGPIRHYAGHVASHLDHQLISGPGPILVIVFLLAHGIIKLALVYCLLREYLWVYPYALIVLGLFTVYQIFLMVRNPTASVGLFLALDLAIMWLVWREWRQLRTNEDAQAVSGSAAS